MSRPLATESAFRAIAHPLRRRILDALRRNEYSVGELHQALSDIGRASLSDHLRILRESQLIKQRRKGTFRMYTLNIDPIRMVASWCRPFDAYKPPAASKAVS